MPDGDRPDDPAREDPAPPAPVEGAAPRSRARARASVAEVFGDVLPETTQDERDAGSGGGRGGSDERDEALLRDVPPHHG